MLEIPFFTTKNSRLHSNRKPDNLLFLLNKIFRRKIRATPENKTVALHGLHPGKSDHQTGFSTYNQ
ncbi:MAG: hypothetical protein CSB48_01180 [Proteobacteria bacterium]|nr:MAG: hypothetical protein CSB48_01180 [Pseudomonadota bacterium]